MVHAAVEAIFRQEAGRVLATLVRLLGDLESAEEARSDAFAAALEQWPREGLPDQPRAWLIRTGQNKAIDRWRRNRVLGAARVELAEALDQPFAPPDDDAVGDEAFGDDRLRLIFTCCHPAIALETQVALTLRAVCGLSTDAVARAFLVAPETMAQRLVRAQKKIRDAGIPYETPEPPLLDERIDGVLAAIYLVFTEGYASPSPSPRVPDAPDLCDEALRLGRLLDALLPARGAILGLLALMLLHDARRPARLAPDGDLVLLDEQDRTRWKRDAIDEGLALVDRALRARVPISGYAVQAAIAALHVSAATPADTDWPQIVGLYEVLVRLQPGPVVELNHAVAVAMTDGPRRALDLVDALRARGTMRDYHLLAAVRADLLRRLERLDEAAVEYEAALRSAHDEAERRFLARRLQEVRRP